jgi:hypothetical protein
MEPEEMDVIELLENVSVDPEWAHDREVTLSVLTKGERGMVVHREDATLPLFTVEFLDLASGQLRALAILRGDQIRVVERNTLGGT